MTRSAWCGRIVLALVGMACGSGGDGELAEPYAHCWAGVECEEGVCKPNSISPLANAITGGDGVCVPSCVADADCPPLADGPAVCLRGDCVPGCAPAIEGWFIAGSETICIDGQWSECADLSERPCRCNCGADFVCPPRADGLNLSNEQRDLDELCVPRRTAGEACDADWQCSGGRCSPLRGPLVCVERAGTSCDASTVCDCEAGADGTGYCKADCQGRFEGNTCGSSYRCDQRMPPLDPSRFVPDPPYTTEGRCYLRCYPDSPSCPGSTTCRDSFGLGVNDSGTFSIYICLGSL